MQSAILGWSAVDLLGAGLTLTHVFMMDFAPSGSVQVQLGNAS
jgi:hypothetical protein